MKKFIENLWLRVVYGVAWYEKFRQYEAGSVSIEELSHYTISLQVE